MNKKLTMEKVNSKNSENGKQLSRKIQTFVFFDLETTGLFNNPRILEISLVALSRNDLIAMRSSRKPVSNINGEVKCHSPSKLCPPSMPRVLHKFLRLYYPKVLIHPEVEVIHGLSNDLMCDLPPFTLSGAESIDKFLDFPKPICFVAHNGSSFDYRIFKAELENVHAKGFDDILCIDSLHTLRYLDKKEEEDEIKAITDLAQDFLDNDFLDEDVSKKIKTDDSNSYNSETNNIYETPEKNKDSLVANMTIPETPKKIFKPTVEMHTPPLDSTNVSNTTNAKNSGVKRALKFGKCKQFKPYTQSAIYTRLFGVPFEGHRAESDTLALAQICSCYGKRFAEYADDNAKEFSKVTPRWTVRKSFKL